MASLNNLTPLEIKIDQEAIRDQVKSGIEEALRSASSQLRMAADALDPSFLDDQRKWIEDEINDRVEKRLRLKEAEK